MTQAVPILTAESFWRWRCRVRYGISSDPHPLSKPSDFCGRYAKWCIGQGICFLESRRLELSNYRLFHGRITSSAVSTAEATLSLSAVVEPLHFYINFICILFEDIPAVELMYIFFYTRVTVGDSDLCCCTCVMYFECYLTPLFVDSVRALWAPSVSDLWPLIMQLWSLLIIDDITSIVLE